MHAALQHNIFVVVTLVNTLRLFEVIVKTLLEYTIGPATLSPHTFDLFYYKIDNQSPLIHSVDLCYADDNT